MSRLELTPRPYITGEPTGWIGREPRVDRAPLSMRGECKRLGIEFVERYQAAHPERTPLQAALDLADALGAAEQRAAAEGLPHEGVPLPIGRVAMRLDLGAGDNAPVWVALLDAEGRELTTPDYARSLLPVDPVTLTQWESWPLDTDDLICNAMACHFPAGKLRRTRQHWGQVAAVALAHDVTGPLLPQVAQLLEPHVIEADAQWCVHVGHFRISTPGRGL